MILKTILIDWNELEQRLIYFRPNRLFFYKLFNQNSPQINHQQRDKNQIRLFWPEPAKAKPHEGEGIEEHDSAGGIKMMKH